MASRSSLVVGGPRAPAGARRGGARRTHHPPDRPPPAGGAHTPPPARPPLPGGGPPVSLSLYFWPVISASRVSTVSSCFFTLPTISAPTMFPSLSTIYVVG